jgi:hypothetical protein
LRYTALLPSIISYRLTNSLAGNNNTEEGNHIYKNKKTYREEPGQVQKTNYIDWTGGQHPRILV